MLQDFNLAASQGIAVAVTMQAEPAKWLLQRNDIEGFFNYQYMDLEGDMARVLVVDDDRSFLKALRRLLSLQYKVFSASDAGDALEIISGEFPIDLVICDVTMPAISGPQLVGKIAQISPATAFVLMTGMAKERVALPQGVTLLQKPFSMDELFSAINKVLIPPE